MPIRVEGVKFYSIIDAAKELDLTPQTVRKYVKEGKLKSKRVGKPILITDKHIKELRKAMK